MRFLSFLSTALPLLLLLFWSAGVNAYYTVPFVLGGAVVAFDIVLLVVAKMKFQAYQLVGGILGIVIPLALYAVFVLLRALWLSF